MDSTAGFVLTGGRSSRRGRDKALLSIKGTALVTRTAERVRAAAGSVTLIGAPKRFAHLNLPAVAEHIPAAEETRGPIGDLYAALALTGADWDAEHGTACLVPETTSGRHPPCAVYHRRNLAAAKAAIDDKRFRMHDLLRLIQAVPWPVADARILENVNTPPRREAR